MRRLPALDYLRITAAILVIAVHADTITPSPTNYLGGISWWFAMTVNTLGRASVPLFVMLSGALIYRTDRGLSFTKILARSWSRIIVPGLLWIPFYFWWMHTWHGDPFTWSYILRSVWSTNFGYLHYLLIILGLYLATPLLVRIPAEKRAAIAWISMFFMLGFELVRYTSPGWAWMDTAPILWMNYLPYYLLGSVLLGAKRSFPRLTLTASLLLSALLLAVTCNYIGIVQGNAHHVLWWMYQGTTYFWDHFSVTDIVISLSLYYLFTAGVASGLGKPLDRLAAYAGGATYGIYLVHVFVMDVVERYGHFQVFTVQSALWLYYLEKIALIFIFSYLFVILTRILKLHHYLYGEK